MTTMLEVTTEEYEKLKVSAFVLVNGYVNEAGEWTRTWVDAIGTREECQEEADSRAGHIYVVPTGVRLEYEIVEASKIAPPEPDMP